MNKFKIVEIEDPNVNQVLIALVRTDEGKDIVELSAWHDIDEGLFYQVEHVEFPFLGMAEKYIDDFSLPAAVTFVDSFNP